jgi:hypothetical protein
MSGIGQAEAPWRPVVSAMAEITWQMTLTVLGRVAEAGTMNVGEEQQRFVKHKPGTEAWREGAGCLGTY